MSFPRIPGMFRPLPTLRTSKQPECFMDRPLTDVDESYIKRCEEHPTFYYQIPRHVTQNHVFMMSLIQRAKALVAMWIDQCNGHRDAFRKLPREVRNFGYFVDLLLDSREGFVRGHDDILMGNSSTLDSPYRALCVMSKLQAKNWSAEAILSHLPKATRDLALSAASPTPQPSFCGSRNFCGRRHQTLHGKRRLAGWNPCPSVFF
ncbi:hypothetical protein AWB71_05302 [Caballeronia peredens]|nr:hypothetical protein AWB71_05302 [Caballeronia peredens]